MRYALAALLITLCGEAEAQTPIPAYDVDAICAKEADPQARAYCLRLEQASYDTLKMLWPVASDESRRYAIKGAEGAMASRAYYQIMQQYLEGAMRNEQIARDAASPPKFVR
jgi:hypothetical protein